MGKKTTEQSKYREWERERRERLNISFNDLGSLLPNHDPAISTSKVDILQNSAAYIRDLKKENSELLLGGSNKIQTKKIKRLQRYVEVLLLRVQQLAKILKDAGISLPPEPPSITPLGEKPLRWSNKLTPKDAEKVLQSGKSPTNTSLKKSKANKKTEKKNASAEKNNKEAGVDSPKKANNQSSTVKNSSAEISSSGNKLRTNQRKPGAESPNLVLSQKEKTSLESRPPMPVSQIFGDTSHMLTSLPHHVVGADQQPGIIVIRTTGASTLSAVTQQAPQSTCFVIDNGNTSAVGNGQASTLVTSHPPTLEQRPTFVLASNGSLLPVLSAPQFVTQPRQLIVSTTSPPIPPVKQPITALPFAPSSNNPPCRKLREVACSKPLNGDISQKKKVPIPALPRNKQKLVLNSKESKDRVENSSKLSSKKKCIASDGGTSKTNKCVTLKAAEKKNVKSVSEIASQVKLRSPNQVLPQDNNVSVQKSEKTANDKKESNFNCMSEPHKKDNPVDNRKRELDMKDATDNVQLKRKKCDNSNNEDRNVPQNSMEKQVTNTPAESICINSPNCNLALNSNSKFNSSSGSVSSYSINALCKMNEKISADSGSESLKGVACTSKENSSSDPLNARLAEGKNQLENISMPENVEHNNSSALESIPKSVSAYSTIGISSEECAKSTINGNDKSETIVNTDSSTDREKLIQLNSPENQSPQPKESSAMKNDSVGSTCGTGNASPNRTEPSMLECSKGNETMDVGIKEKAIVQSPILPSFGSSPNYPNSQDDVYRKEGESRGNNCDAGCVDESSLPPGTFSSDLFASLQVPSGHSESISPTAAFLLAFPLVSTLTSKTPDLGSDNPPSQTLTSLDSGNGDSEHSSGGCGSSFLQLGNLEDNSPSSSSQSILSSLSSSNPPSSQSSILHLKSANTLHSLIPSSIETDYEHDAVGTDIHLVENQISSSKGVSPKQMVSKDTPFIATLPSSFPLKENQKHEENLGSKEALHSVCKTDVSPPKSHIVKERSSECRNQAEDKISSAEGTDANNIIGRFPSHVQKATSCDNTSVSNSMQSVRLSVSSAATKTNIHTCNSHQFEGRSEGTKKEAIENNVLTSSNQQYIPYQMPYISCNSTGLSEPNLGSNGLLNSDGSGNGMPTNLRQDMQVLDHALSSTSTTQIDLSNLSQNSSSITFPSVSPQYKTVEKIHSIDHKPQIQNNTYPPNNYSQYNPASSLPSSVSSTSCFTISSFTSSFSSSASNSILSSCTVTTSSPSFSSPNSAPLLTTSTSYPSSSVPSFPPHSNVTYLNSSTSYIPPVYSNTVTQTMPLSASSFPNVTFTSVSEPVLSSAPTSKTTATSSKTSVASLSNVSSSHQNSFGNHQVNTAPNLPPTSFVNSGSSTECGSNGLKLNSQPVSTSHQNCVQTSKNSSASVEQKTQNHESSSSMNLPISEPVKSHIFSIDQLNTQNYGYNFNDYTSHVPSYMPQKPEMEMMSRKPPNLSTETISGNITSRMPGSFSVAHNSSNFSILSWTTLSPMSAAPSSSIEPHMNSTNGKIDAYSANPVPIGLPLNENGSASCDKVTDPHATSFPQPAIADSRDINSSYPQFPVGNSSNVGTEMNGSSGYSLSQDVGKQSISRGHGTKQRQQVTNWMTAPDPIHSSSDFSHNNDTVSNENVRDAFGNNAASYGSNSGFYGHHNHIDVAYASSTNTSAGINSCLDSRNSTQSSAVGSSRNSYKGCSNIPEVNSSLADNILQLQSKAPDGQQGQLPCTYDKMSNSSGNYIHHAQGDLPALPTLVGDLALGSCSSMKGYLPVYDEANSIASKVGKIDMGKAQSSNANNVSCNNVLSAKENRDNRHSSNEYVVSSFLSVSQLVDHVKDSSQQNQVRENEREKIRNRETNKSSPTSRRNVRPSNVKRDGSKEQLDHPQISHSRLPAHDTQAFHNQGITSSVVSSNPTHLHAPPIPFPPYKSMHWPVNEMTKASDNSRNISNYKSSSSYSAEALIRPSLSAVPMDSRIPDVDMSAYAMDIHKFPIPAGRSDHLFPDFVDSNNITSNVDAVPQQQNQLKQQSQDQRQGNENFRASHHSHCERFNYSSSVAPSSSFHSHHHHPHLPHPNFGSHDDYAIDTANTSSSLGLPTNAMEFPFTHPKDAGPLTSSASNVCLPIGYNPSNSCLGVNQNQNQQCRTSMEKTNMRVSSGNCEEPTSRSTVEHLGPSKIDCNSEGRTKSSAKETASVINNNARSIPPFLPMESNSASYIGHHHYHPHSHQNSPPHYPGGTAMGAAHITPLNNPDHQAPKLFPRLPPPTSGMTHLPHQSSTTNSTMGCGNSSGGNLSSGTLTNFNLSTIFPEINDKQSHHNQMATSTSSFGTSSKNDKLCTVSSSAPILHPPPPLSTSYHHQPHQHNHQPFPPPVNLGNRLPPPHPSSRVLHSNVSFNNLMVQSSPQVNGIGINSPLQPPPPPFSAPSFANVLPGL